MVATSADNKINAFLAKSNAAGGIWDLPAYAAMGIQGAYWSTAGRLDEFDKKLFVTQVAAMCQLTGELMLMNFN